MYKGSIYEETDIVGIGKRRVDDAARFHLEDASCLQPVNKGFEDRLSSITSGISKKVDLATAE